MPLLREVAVDWDIILPSVSIVVSGGLAVWANRIGREAARASEAAATAAKEANGIAGKANQIADASLKLAKSSSDNQMLLAQRQQFLALWEHMSQMQKGLPQDAKGTPEEQGAAAHVVRQVNALELIAVSCEAGIVDEAVIVRTFMERFIEMADWIEDLGEFEALGGKTGKELLRENPAIGTLKAKFVKKKEEGQKVPALPTS